MRNQILSASLSAVSFLLLACGGGGGTGSDGDGKTFTAKIDGQAWEAQEIGITASINAGVKGSVILNGTSGEDKSRSITITLYNVRGPGKYALGVGTQAYGGTGHVGEATGVNANAHTWITPGTGDDGEVEITALGDGRIKGTFFFNVDTTGTRGRNEDDTRIERKVTEGKFDLPLTGTPEALPDSVGRKVTAKVGGVYYNGATIALAIMTDYTGKPGFQFSSSTSKHGISIMLEGVTDTGTFGLTNFPPIRTITAGRNSTDPEKCCWQTTAGDVGEIKVTSVMKDPVTGVVRRVKGTFKGTIKPSSGKPATAPLEITEGTFDVGIGLFF